MQQISEIIKKTRETFDLFNEHFYTLTFIIVPKQKRPEGLTDP